MKQLSWWRVPTAGRSRAWTAKYRWSEASGHAGRAIRVVLYTLLFSALMTGVVTGISTLILSVSGLSPWS